MSFKACSGLFLFVVACLVSLQCSDNFYAIVNRTKRQHSQRHSRAIIQSVTTHFYALTLLILALDSLVKLNTQSFETLKYSDRWVLKSLREFAFFSSKRLSQKFETEIELFFLRSKHVIFKSVLSFARHKNAQQYKQKYFLNQNMCHVYIHANKKLSDEKAKHTTFNIGLSHFVLSTEKTTTTTTVAAATKTENLPELGLIRPNIKSEPNECHLKRKRSSCSYISTQQ